MTAPTNNLPQEARRLLLTVSDEAQAVDALVGIGYDESTAQEYLRTFLAERAHQNGGPPDWSPEPQTFDFAAEPEAPDWIVRRLIERGTVVVLSGDTGAAKSIVTSALVPPALDRARWLDHETYIERVTVIDEENPGRLVRARLRALRADNEHRERLRYFNREGVAIGDRGRSDAWLRSHLAEFKPDLVVIDTLMAACALEDTNSNPEAVRMMKFLRSLAREFGCSILLLHHERKQSKDHPASSGQAMLGARQWAGQADAHMTLTVESDLIEEDAATEGHRRLRRTFKWRPAEKDRDGRPNRPQRVAVESEKDASGRLLWMTVENEGPIDPEGARDAAEAVIVAALRDADGDGLMARRQLAAAAGEKEAGEPGGTFKRALAGLVDAGKVETVGRRYRVTQHGRETAALAV